MSVLVGRDSKVVVQGMGKHGTFHALAIIADFDDAPAQYALEDYAASLDDMEFSDSDTDPDLPPRTPTTAEAAASDFTIPGSISQAAIDRSQEALELAKADIAGDLHVD